MTDANKANKRRQQACAFTFEPMPISHGDAMSSVQKLKEYVMQHNETLGVSLCHMLDDVERKISNLTIKSRSQADIRSQFGAGTQ
jgi:hypothetical protein